jgi:predicted amidohydrolase
MGKSAVSVGLVQICAKPFDVDANRDLAAKSAAVAFDQGADIVILPEMVVQGYVVDPSRLLSLAESVNGPTVKAFNNSAVAVGPEGTILHYRKAHLFAKEKTAFRPGNLGFPVVPTRFGMIGVCICYDLRFVEVVRIMALRGADLICVPTAWLPGFDAERWDRRGMCPQAWGAVHQANLSQVFIACASQAGNNGEFDFLGSSCLVDPFGRLIAGPLPGSEDVIEVTEIDIEATSRARVRDDMITPREDRRTDIYGVVYEGEHY